MLSQAKVLVTDDDDAVHLFLFTLLKRQGYLVDCARNGDEAIDQLGRKSYDAILLDLMMPRTNGFDVLQYLERVSPETARKSVIVLTAASRQMLERLEADNVFRVIHKPFEIDDLMAAVGECCSRLSATS